MPRPLERKIILPGQSKFLSEEENSLAIERMAKEIEERAIRLAKLAEEAKLANQKKNGRA